MIFLSMNKQLKRYIYFTLKVFIIFEFCFGTISINEAGKIVDNVLAQNNKINYSIDSYSLNNIDSFYIFHLNPIGPKSAS